jgi:hypothetical protein
MDGHESSEWEDRENRTLVDPIPAFDAPFEERRGTFARVEPVSPVLIPQ